MKGTSLFVKAFQYIFIITLTLAGMVIWYNSTVYMNINQTTVNIDKYMNSIAAFAQKNNGFNDIAGTSFNAYIAEMKVAYGIEDNIVSESFTPSGIVKKGQECVITVTPQVRSYLGLFESNGTPYKTLPQRTIRFTSHHFIRDVNI